MNNLDLIPQKIIWNRDNANLTYYYQKIVNYEEKFLYLCNRI